MINSEESFSVSKKKWWVHFPNFIVNVMSHGRDHFVSTLADHLVVMLQLSPALKLLIQTRTDSLNSL